MLARGGLSDFLTQDRDSALGAVESSTLTVGGGADFPLGITASLQYSSSNIDRYARSSGDYLATEITQKEWPIFQARWTQTLQRGLLTVVSLSTNIRKRSGQTVLPSTATNALSLTETSTWTNDLQLTFRKGFSLTLGYGTSSDERQSNGTTTLGNGEDLTANLIYLFQLPGNISSARKQVRVSINALSSKSEACLDLPDESECLGISDTRRKTLRAGIDTDILSILTGGFQAAYVLNDVRQLNRKTEQLTLSLTFQLSLFSGDY
jgi:hypothetical protein